jgi:hypothetical protein
MSGELKPKNKFVVGEEIIAYRRIVREMERRPAVVVETARVWAVAEVEGIGQRQRFRMDNGIGDNKAWWSFSVPSLVRYNDRVAAAWETLKAHGLTSGHLGSGSIHDVHLFAVAELLELLGAADAPTEQDQEPKEGN